MNLVTEKSFESHDKIRTIKIGKTPRIKFREVEIAIKRLLLPIESSLPIIYKFTLKNTTDVKIDVSSFESKTLNATTATSAEKICKKIYIILLFNQSSQSIQQN